ncbi:hypothetical protein GE061_014583 [Apolygus lucorum]|uniref:Uncharacterized protein n=1 Tax=Apolygus lucorum TaxID=248454 RepID=A0A8S9XIM0_APOLU|nr:hypothetical protein GE061_014583 [Apolygus lucorum]
MTNIKKTLKSQSQDTDGEPMATDTREAAAADKAKKGMKLKILRVGQIGRTTAATKMFGNNWELIGEKHA